MTRTIKAIAKEIKQVWVKPNYAAVPYLDAMLQVEKPDDMFYAEKASSLVAYFLSNASTFRGEDARRLKAELKKVIGQ